jgi:hypothetical protein
MKTTTYIFANGKTSVTTSDRNPLTREQYAKACYIIRGAAKAEIARRKALHRACRRIEARDRWCNTYLFPQVNLVSEDAHVLTERARESLGCRLASTLRAYDNDQRVRSQHPTKRPVFYNLHALCLYHEALARAMDSLQHEGVTVEMALAENFEGALLKALLKAYSKMLPAKR